jgi:hypothetical protein
MNARHVIYAAKCGLWPILFAAPVFAFLVIIRRGTIVDFAYGMAPIVAISAGMFAYYLWRVIQKR